MQKDYGYIFGFWEIVMLIVLLILIILLKKINIRIGDKLKNLNTENRNTNNY
jgi:hypothetical protein